ncbi:hypothetical protein MBT84_10405 [Streptomyces sp. MBT84]|nr:hypothetical protein [Streptomyces sp. MBT84]
MVEVRYVLLSRVCDDPLADCSTPGGTKAVAEFGAGRTRALGLNLTGDGMRGNRRTALAGSAVVGMVVLAGCADRSEVVTWTDEHGRVCTGVAVVDSDDGDREVTSIDCDYPPEGRTPGPTTWKPLPG